VIRGGTATVLFAALLLGACTPLAVAGVAQALIGGGEGKGGAMSPGGVDAPTIQNGGAADESVMKALDLADNAAVSAICRQALPDLPPLAAGQCDTRPICLPGAKAPLTMRVCALPEKPSDTLAQAEISRPPAWQWEAAQ
jgi:hypothetical protein